MSDKASAMEQSEQAVLTSASVTRFDRWETPEFEPGGDPTDSGRGMSVTRLESLQKQAYEEAYATGLREGREAGESLARSEGQRFDALIQQLARPFESLDDCVEKQVVQLAMIVARNIIRRELKTDPTHVIGAVREALSALPVSARDVRVKLHPEDAELVRKYLKPVEGDRAWHIQEDPVLTRGSCRVHTEFSHVDARIESRISALVASLFGDERDAQDARDGDKEHE